MSLLELFKDWLSDVPNATAFSCLAGHWSSFESSIDNRYIACSVVGGESPRELDTRIPHISVAIVGAKGESLAVIQELADDVVAHAQVTPQRHCLTAVNVLGDVLGPMQTVGGRPVLALTLQMIT